MKIDAAVWLHAALIAAFTAFNLFDDKPLAFYVSMALLGCVLVCFIGRKAGKRMAVVCAFGLFLYGSTAAGGLLYSHLQNGWQYLIDAGTGAPASAITLLVGVLIAGWLVGKRDG